MFAFQELSAKIRNYVGGIVPQSFWKVDFRREGEWLTAPLIAADFTVPIDYFLGIHTAQDPNALFRLVENRDEFKLMPLNWIDRAIYGLPLKKVHYSPPQLPGQTGLHYFQLNKVEGARHWAELEKEKRAAIRWPAIEGSDYKVALYMVVPPDAPPRG